MPPPSDLEALYETVANKIAGLIETGALRAGDRLPSVRRSSKQHGVSINTAIQAYRLLENRALIEARPKSGFFVRPQTLARLEEPARSEPSNAATTVGVGSLQARIFDAVRAPEVAPFGAAYPGADALPIAKLARITASVARSAGSAGAIYDMPPGSERLRRQIARRSLDWGANLSPDDFITTCGGTEAIGIALRAVAKPGEVIAVESPTYFGILQIIEDLGLKAIEIPMHPRDGMDLDSLERCLRSRKISACIAVPNFSNPLGSLMPDERKQKLVELLEEYDLPLIEDDINGDLSHEGIRPRVVQSFDKSGRVLLCGSFSKTLAPGYRVGWIAPGRYYERAKTLKFSSTLATASLPQLAIAEFVANGGFDRHLQTLRRSFALQIAQTRDAIARYFPAGTKLTRPRGGFVLWVELPPDVSALELHERALREKISIAPGPMFSPKQEFRNFIRVNCGNPWTSQAEMAMRKLGELAGKT